MTIRRHQDILAGAVILSWSFLYGRWWGSIVHVIQGLNTSAVQRVSTWIGPWSLITTLAWIVDAYIFFELGFNQSNLTVLPYFLDGFPTSLTRCGTLAGIRKRWDFKVNPVEVTWWISSHKLRLRLRLLLLGSKMLFSINSSLHKLNLISNISSNSSPSNNLGNMLTPHPLHRIHNHQGLKRQIHLHQWHLKPLKLDPLHPSILKRWCNRWSTQSNPASKLS